MKSLAVTSCLIAIANAKMQILSPTKLRDELGEIHTKLSNLGVDHKNKMMIGQVIAPYINNTQGCEKFKESDFIVPRVSKKGKTKNNKIILVERGGCSFYWKYKNAINYGAEVLLVSDFSPEATEEFKAM